MLKNRFKIIVLIMLVILFFIAPFVNAEDNEAPGEVVTTSNEEQANVENANQQTTTQNNYKDGDVYLTGTEITIDYIVDGNLFVFADTVNINSQIGGDAFIIARTVNVNNGGYVFSNLFTIANTLNVNGVVYDLYASSTNINISGYVYRDVRTSSEDFKISGVVGRNAYITTNNILFETISNEENQTTKQGTIAGNLNYTAKTELSIPEGVVKGTINYTEAKETSPTIGNYLLALGRFLVTVIIIWLLCLWLAPKLLSRTHLVLTKKLPSSIGLGILTPFVVIVISAILMLITITSTIAMIGIVLLLLICMLGSAIFVISLANLFANKLKVENKVGTLGILIITSAVIWLICLIPFVGNILSLIVAILGIGILVNNILPSTRKKDFSSTDTKKEKTEKVKKAKNTSTKKESK